MHIRHRLIHLQNDLPQVLNLADVSGLNAPHIADWPYRFSSWALADAQNTQLWFDAPNQLLGWVVMQTPFWAIDCLVHPDAPASLYQEMLAWAKTRAAELSAAGQGRPMWFVSIPADQQSRHRDLEAQGFYDQSDAGDDAWSKVLFQLDLGDDVDASAAPCPQGFAIRSLNTTTEIQAYVDLHRGVFQSESMTYDWRESSTRASGYINDLDLVIASNQGDLVGFCIAWLRKLATGETVGQIEPLGVRESERGQKLSKALLSEAIQYLHRHGATRVFVETDRQRDSAMAAYMSMGFCIAHEVLVYRYIAPADAPTL